MHIVALRSLHFSQPGSIWPLLEALPQVSRTRPPPAIFIRPARSHFALATSVGVRPPGQNKLESQIATSSLMGAGNWIPTNDIEVYPEHIIRVSHCLQTFSPSHRPPRPAFSPPTAPTGAADTCSSNGRRVGMVGRAGRGRGRARAGLHERGGNPNLRDCQAGSRAWWPPPRPSVHPRGGFWAGSRLPA